MQPIILASQSPRRKQLLEWAEIDFEVMVSNTDETYPSDLLINEIPVYIARQKALEIRKNLINNIKPILAADTIVFLNNEIIGKPKDEEEAINHLKKLQGKSHTVTTGVVIIFGEKEISFAESTLVHFNILSIEQIEYYVKTYKPYDKAGAYAIQEWVGVVGISKIDGDFYNVMGLPINKVYSALSEL